MDSLLNPLAPQDNITLGITRDTSWLLKFVAALLDPVPLHIVTIPKDQLTTMVLVEGCNLYSTLSPIE
jgi:hypothetical protein